MIWAFASSITTKILFNGSTVGSTSLKMSHSTKKIDQIDQNFFSKHFNLVKSKLEKGFLKRHLTILHEFYSEVCKWDILGDFPTLWGVRTSITVGNYCWWFWVGLNCCSFWQWDARTSRREKTLTYRQLSLDKLRNGMHVILSLSTTSTCCCLPRDFRDGGSPCNFFWHTFQEWNHSKAGWRRTMHHSVPFPLQFFCSMK